MTQEQFEDSLMRIIAEAGRAGLSYDEIIGTLELLRHAMLDAQASEGEE
jgi:hypothetical protein